MSIQNINLARNNYFRAIFSKYPDLDFFIQEVTFPGVTAGPTEMPTPQRLIPIPDNVKIFDQFNVLMMVDEDFKSWETIFTWFQEYTEEHTSVEDMITDVDIILYKNSLNVNRRLKYFNAFPIAMTEMQLTSNTPEPVDLSFNITFAYTGFKFEN